MRQRLIHLAMRIQNLEAQALGPEMETILTSFRGQVVAALQEPSRNQQIPMKLSPTLSSLEEEKEPELAAPPVAFSGMAGAFYHKLPNPLAEVVQRLPVVDGLDADKLLNFFKIFFQLADFPGVSDRTLLELIYPYCRGSMAERVIHALRDGGGIDSFHGEVLDAFIPGRLRERLRQKYFYRVQANGEGLAQFMASIREAVKFLRLGLSEPEIIQIILEGVTPVSYTHLDVYKRQLLYWP